MTQAQSMTQIQDDPYFWIHQRSAQEKYQEYSAYLQLAYQTYESRKVDGTDNNPENSHYGSAGSQLLRITPHDYGDGISTPAGADRPSAREISNEIFAQSESIPNPDGASAMLWLWGQFIDHDFDLSVEGNEPFNIPVPAGDAYFDPMNTGTQEIHLNRSAYDPDSSPREQLNAITAYLDASNVYGSDEARASFLRTYENGEMKLSEYGMLPFNNGEYDNAGGNSTTLYLAGDVRSNENVGLTAMHTVFAHEHNHWAKALHEKFPHLSDEEIFHKAKMMVEAEIQAITFNEFLPMLLGKDAIPDYAGYDPTVNPQVANVYSTAAYRLGHTMLGTTILRLNEDGTEYEGGHLALRDAFFAPFNMQSEAEMAAVLRGFASMHAEKVDAKIVDDVRNFLFGQPGSGGFDLASLNIQRGRDHGLADYNSARVAYGLEAKTSISDITSDPAMQAILSELYNDDVNNIDVFVGGLVEDTHGDSMLGELFHTIVLDQFLRMRSGDRMWYEDRLPEDLVKMVNETSLSDIIVRNTEIEFLQDDVMLDYTRVVGTNEPDELASDADHVLYVGLNANDIIESGASNDVIFSGDGDDHLVFLAGNGHDVVRDFTPSHDQIDVSDYHISQAQLYLETYKEGSDTVIYLPGNNSITLANISPVELQDSDFIL